MLEGTLCELIIQILIRFNSLICRQEFQNKSGVSSRFTNVNEQDYFYKICFWEYLYLSDSHENLPEASWIVKLTFPYGNG